MFSQSCNFLPHKKQTSFVDPIQDNLGIFRNFTMKSFQKFEGSSVDVNLDETKSVTNLNQDHITSKNNISLMDFVCSFRDSSGMKLRNSLSNFPVSTHGQKHTNCREIGLIAHYTIPSVSNMSFASSHLVGGFVGSKSQLGRRPNNGFGFKMWDLIREFVDLMGHSSTQNSPKEKPQLPEAEKRCSNVTSCDKIINSSENVKCCRLVDTKCEEERTCPAKQSYADVTKSKIVQPVRPMHSVKEIIPANLESSGDQKINCFSRRLNSSKPVIEPILRCSQSCPPNRDRITSECSADSEDSFIVFEYCEGDESSFDDDDDGGSSSGDESVLDFQISNKGSPSDCGSEPSKTLSKNKEPIKKVRFAEGKNLTKVHPMVKWNYAYRTARRGPWEMLARDSERFKCRINNTEAVLKPILDPQHRESVFHQRFSNLSS